MQKLFRKFLGYEVGTNNITLKELSELSPIEITAILSKIATFSKTEHFPTKSYEDYNTIQKGLGRFKIGSFRIYTLKIATNAFLILHIFKKKTQKIPENVKIKIVKRAKYYEQNLKEQYKKWI